MCSILKALLIFIFKKLFFLDPCADCDVQDFNNTKEPFASEGNSDAPLPTNPSVNLNTTIQTSPCDSASAASTAYLPTSLSDSSISSVEKPGEGLTYATVRFHTNASSSDAAAPMIRFKKEDELCEYATVSHGNKCG